MSQMDIKVEEYKSLRSSIDMHLKLILEILAFMVAATSALLGYGFSLGSTFGIFNSFADNTFLCVFNSNTNGRSIRKRSLYNDQI